MAHPVFSAGATALITGGASGIGLAIAQRCVAHGMKVGLVDVDEAALAAAKASLVESAGEAEEEAKEAKEAKVNRAEVEVTTYVADVSKVEAWREVKAKVVEKYGGAPNLLVLNAGVSGGRGGGGGGGGGGWEDLEYFRRVLDTNLYGVINGLATFLPSIRQTATTSSSAIVITGSKQGITNPPGNPAYNASKAALKSLAEQLSYDLRQTAAVSVHLLVPGWTFTGLTGGGATKAKPAGAWSAAQVAEYLEAAMARGEFYVLCPDNDVSEDADRKRVLWAAGDVVARRPPLSRWREEWRERAREGIERMEL